MATIKYKDKNGQWQEIAIGGGGSSVEVVDSLDSESTTAALSANQGRVLKEMIEELPSGGGGLETRILYVPELTAGSELTDEEKAYNVETCQKLLTGTARALINAYGAILTYSEDILDLAAAEDSGYYIQFSWNYIFPIQGIIVGADGDILQMTSVENDRAYVLKDGMQDTQLLGIISGALSSGRCLNLLVEVDGTEYSLHSLQLINSYPRQIQFDAYPRSSESFKWVIGTITNEGVSVNVISIPTMLKLSPAQSYEKERNAKWLQSVYPTQLTYPFVEIGNRMCKALSVEKSSSYADIVVCNNGGLETWRINSDGTTTQITE